MVVVILGTLFAMSLPNFVRVLERAKEAGVKANVHNVQIAVELWVAANDGSAPGAEDIGPSLFARGVFPDNPFTRAPLVLGPLAAYSRGDVGYGSARQIYVIEGYGAARDSGPGSNGVVITLSNGRGG
ncbi:MAG: hypothetical protein R6X25_01675 [Candidatus Krumholzibacteriia bacterium]